MRIPCEKLNCDVNSYLDSLFTSEVYELPRKYTFIASCYMNICMCIQKKNVDCQKKCVILIRFSKMLTQMFTYGNTNLDRLCTVQL